MAVVERSWTIFYWIFMNEKYRYFFYIINYKYIFPISIIKVHFGCIYLSLILINKSERVIDLIKNKYQKVYLKHSTCFNVITIDICWINYQNRMLLGTTTQVSSQYKRANNIYCVEEEIISVSFSFSFFFLL